MFYSTLLYLFEYIRIIQIDSTRYMDYEYYKIPVTNGVCSISKYVKCNDVYMCKWQPFPKLQYKSIIQVTFRKNLNWQKYNVAHSYNFLVITVTRYYFIFGFKIWSWHLKSKIEIYIWFDMMYSTNTNQYF